MKTEKLKNSKGITLIALIITIIIMLILVGVTVNEAIQGGLFESASDASKKTQKKAYEEKLTVAIAASYDVVTGEINGNDLISNLGTNWSVEGSGPYTCTIDGNTFTVSKKGEIVQTLNYEEIFKTATKHPNQQTTNDIGIAEDGSQVNLDLWNYEYQLYGTSGYSLGTAASMGMAGYENSNIVSGKIQGKVPMYIKAEGETNFYPVTMMYGAFAYCTDMTEGPEIPSTVTDMYGAFLGCTSLRNIQEIPYSVTSLYNTFQGCTSLKTAPTIPNSVTNMSMTFYRCTNLTTAPEIPSSVTNMKETFYNCTNLTGELIINSNPTSYLNCLSGAVTGTGCNLVLKGECPRDTLTAIAMTQSGTSIPSNITIGK